MNKPTKAKTNFRRWLLALAVSPLLILTACGGGGGSDTTVTPVVAVRLSGTVAAGAPMIGQVTVKGSLGNSISAFIEADGSYDIDVSTLTAPFRLRAEGTVGGRNYRLHSYAEAADVNGNINITPFTDLIVANAAQQIAESYFDSTTPAEITSAALAAQEQALKNKLQNVFTALGISAAIDLLRSSFSADHTGLDAALDIIRIEIGTSANVATITNLIENTSIEDNYLDDDFDDVNPLSGSSALGTAVGDIQALTAKFGLLAAAFANGLPNPTTIENLFTTDFFDEDTPLAVWLTDITTDPSVVGLRFPSIVVSNLDSSAGTATVTFNVAINGIVDLEPVVWEARRDSTLGWQLRGDQRIAGVEFSFHCNDNDGNGGFAGACGVNTRFEDDDFTNNGSVAAGAPIASATVSIINGVNDTVKDVIYLGNNGQTGFAGEGNVWDEATGSYMGDYKGFGTGAGQIDPSIFAVGDFIEYKLYTQALDVSTPATPQIASGAIPIATYRDRLLFLPANSGKYPVATAATLSAISSFTQGDSLAIGWTLAPGTRNDEVLVEISDDLGNRVEAWVDTFGTTALTATFASALLDSAASSSAGLDPNAARYNLLVRIYAEDVLTGQAHSRDYNNVNIPGPGAVTPPPPTTLACNFESGWLDTANGGLGAPIVPKSFADFEATLADCGTAQAFGTADVAGFGFDDGAGEFTVFSPLGQAAGTEQSRGSGQFSGDGALIDFQWWIEPATCSGCTHSYLVQFSDYSLDIDLPVNFSLNP